MCLCRSFVVIFSLNRLCVCGSAQCTFWFRHQESPELQSQPVKKHLSWVGGVSPAGSPASGCPPPPLLLFLLLLLRPPDPGLPQSFNGADRAARSHAHHDDVTAHRWTGEMNSDFWAAASSSLWPSCVIIDYLSSIIFHR